MEKLTSLNERTKENISGSKQSTAWAKNQNILNELGESENGNLTYKGQPIGRSAKIKYLAQNEWFAVGTSGAGIGVNIFLADEHVLPYGTEIKSIYIYPNDNTLEHGVHINALSAYDEHTYSASWGVISYSTANVPWLANIWSIEDTPVVAMLQNQECMISIEYYI